MFKKLFARLKTWEGSLDKTYGYGFHTPEGRKKAWRHYLWLDHGILRVLWTNLDEIAPNVWRSNHPSPARLRKYYEMGIRTVLNLRGENKRSHYMFEKEACDALGLQIINLPMNARNLPERRKLLKLLDIFETLDVPFVMHCKSGADRAGLASALYLLHIKEASVAQAKRQLSLRYVHVRSFKTGILDHMLEAYEIDCKSKPVPIRQWLVEQYDPVALTAAFNEIRA